MASKQVAKFKGSQGVWEAEVTYTDGSKEVLPCVHKHYTSGSANGLHYNDPWTAQLLQSKKFAKHVALMHSKSRVILTDDDFDLRRGRGEGCFKRKGYIFVDDINDLVIDDAGMRFRFAGNPIRLRH